MMVMCSTKQHDRIVRHIVEGHFGDAEAAVQELFRDSPDDAEGHMLAGRLAAAQRDYPRELAMMERAVELAPANGQYTALLARSLARGAEIERALALAEEARALEPLDGFALEALAGVLTRGGRHADAAALLRRALDEGARNPAIAFNLGANLKFAGDFEGARRAYGLAIELAPDFYKAHAALTSLGGITADDNHVARLEQLIAGATDPRQAIHLHHAASKEYEALGDHAASWRHLGDGKRALVSAIGRDPAATLPAIDRLCDRLESGIAPPAGEAGAAGPILVLGMPRSGTTVLDRILSNHSAVASIGESLYFAQLLKNACGSRSAELLDAPMLDALDRDDLLALGARYAARGRFLGGGAPRFADKFHLNILLGAHLLRALPDARLLCLLRDPLDTIVSNYRQLFEFDSAIYAYSLDLDATVEMVVRVHRLARLLERIAPYRVRVVRYERLVGEPEGEARGIYAFCGLDWQDGVTAIERNAGSVATASAVQVRAGIHRRSIGAWKRYAPWLDGARARLQAAGLDSGGGAAG